MERGSDKGAGSSQNGHRGSAAPQNDGHGKAAAPQNDFRKPEKLAQSGQYIDNKLMNIYVDYVDVLKYVPIRPYCWASVADGEPRLKYHNATIFRRLKLPDEK